MSIEVSLGWVWLTLLCAIRLAPLLVFTPMLRGFPVPQHVKVLFLLAMAATMVAVSQPAAAPPPDNVVRLMLLCAAEFLQGSVMAFGVHVAFAAYAMAGTVMDIQMGLAMGTVFDPVSRKPSPILASALGMMVATSFFSLDLHHELLRAFAGTLSDAPLGAGWQDIPVQRLVEQFGSIFMLGLSLAAPVVFLLFLMDVGLAVMSRSVPQLNVLFLGLPIKIMLGMGLLALLLPHWTPVLWRVVREALGP